MSGLGPVVAVLSLMAASPPSDARTGQLIDPGRPNAAVVLLSPRAAWSPDAIEGVAICGHDQRCAPIVSTKACATPECPFAFGTQYVLSEDVADLAPLPGIDPDAILALEREPALRPLMERVREAWSVMAPGSGISKKVPKVPKEPKKPKEPKEPEEPPARQQPLQVPEPEQARPTPRRPPGPPSWPATPGWSFESTAVPLVGVAFEEHEGPNNDETHFAFGGMVTVGFRYQLAIPDKQRVFLTGWLGNVFGADLNLCVVHSAVGPQLGLGLDFAGRSVYALTKTDKPQRLRVASMLAFLVPSPGMFIDSRGAVRPNLRLAMPISILLRERVGIESRVDMNIPLLEGEIGAYILLGVGVVLRRPSVS